MAVYYTFGLLALGLILILIEVFIPSMGILGSVAAVSIVTGGVLAFNDDPNGLFVGYLVTAVILIPLMIFSGLKLLPRTSLGKAMMLGGPSFNTKDAKAAEAGLEEMIDLTGEVMTPLRPAGIALINDRRVDVVTQGELIDPGVTVRVVKVEGNRVVVEALDNA